jgi:uncharacterized protein
MLPDLKLVIRLQDIDTRLAELQREIATLPKHIAGIEKKLVAHERKLEADRAALAANQKDRKQCESDIQLQDQKISKLKEQMLEAKTNEQYRAFQNEVDFCGKEIKRLEDRILELMSESEPLDKNVKAAETAFKADKQQVDGEKALARESTAATQKALQELQRERDSVASGLDADVLRDYERTRKSRHGQATAESIDGRCNACHMALRPQYFLDLKQGDQLLHCENCQRILYYNPPQSVEDLTGEPASAIHS